MEPCAEGNALGSQQGGYASVGAFKEALLSLPREDHAKLMIIAKFFWRERLKHLVGDYFAPSDLLQEAVKRTLEGDRKWPLDISVVRFLDRTMESISSHIAASEGKHAHTELKENVSEESLRELSRPVRSRGANPVFEEVVDREDRELLRAHFKDDPEATDVLRLRAEGHSPQEVRELLKLKGKEWNTIRRRIDRKLVKVIKEENERSSP